jgi:hypothetical protein
MSLITNKPKATIYCAENLISGKKYIGRTLRSLEVRRKEHFSKTIKCKHRFATALKCYPEDSWNFYILAEVEYEKADEYEFFFINDLDTCNPEKGYNTLNQPYLGEGETHINFNPEVYHLYHFEHKEVSGNRVELISKYPELKEISKLINGTKKQINGFVLLENKKNYEKITENRAKIGRTVRYVTLTHQEHGTHNLRGRDFINQFNLTNHGIAHLKSGRYKTYRGWMLLKEEETNG